MAGAWAMAEDRAVWEHRVCTRLTAVKLAAQMLDRDRELSDRQRHLVRTAIRAVDDLVADLLERWQAERQQAA